ncbi:MAG: PrsW family glutamic-type intramembrane protease [Pirellulales bacterium]
MHPIYITALFTSILGLGAFGSILWQVTPTDSRKRIFAVLALGMLMSPAAFYWVRTPLLLNPLKDWIESNGQLGGWHQAMADAVSLTFAPLTEEPTKLLPWVVLLLAGVRLSPTKKMVVPIALAAGVGFAVGEIWLIAKMIATADKPEFRQLPWYAFGGFIAERLETCFTHSLFAFPTVVLARRSWRHAVLGLLLGMLLHYLGNAPIVMMKRDFPPLGAGAWSVILQLWVLGFSLFGAVVLLVYHYGSKMLRKILRRRIICPECGCEYRQPILMGLNFGNWRYEQCQVCYKWHWVSLKNLAELPKSTKRESKSSPTN